MSEAVGPAATSGGPAGDPSRIVIELHRDGEEEGGFRDELRAALLERPRRIPSKYFYDDRGSELFEAICELPEYYPTRTERAILEQSAAAIVAKSGACELVELGSGSATKTEVLLDAMAAADQLELYVPFDVSRVMVEQVARRLTARYPTLRVHGVVADFLTHIGKIPAGGRRLAALLGGTIGNFWPEQARDFLRRVAGRLDPGDGFLLGTDLIKDLAVLEPAYNDSAGVTAEFNRNILRVVNRLVDGDFEPAAFSHLAFFDPVHHRIEMRLVSLRRQRVRLANLDLDLAISEGEEILTEISTKYDRPKVESLLTDGGFELVDWFTDPAELFALSLARRV